MNKIILASSSPRRKELLELIGISFTIHPSQVIEEVDEDLLPEQVVEQLALIKAKDVSSNYEEGIIIGADTIVVLDDEILGKPQNMDDAFQMLKRLQGRNHKVYSGVAIINVKSDQSLTSHQMTHVYMNSLTDEEIRLYIDTKEPLDKAGSYGIQGIGSLFIEKIEGDYFNVVGLPLSLLVQLLRSFGINVLSDLIHPKSKV